MRPAMRGFLWHLAGYAAPHLVMASVLAILAVATFEPGGERATRFEAAALALFIAALLLLSSASGYACAIALVARQHAALRLPAMFGVVAGALTFALAATGVLNRIARAANLSVFIALPILGFVVGVAASVLVLLASRSFPREHRV